MKIQKHIEFMVNNKYGGQHSKIEMFETHQEDTHIFIRFSVLPQFFFFYLNYTKIIWFSVGEIKKSDKPTEKWILTVILTLFSASSFFVLLFWLDLFLHFKFSHQYYLWFCCLFKWTKWKNIWLKLCSYQMCVCMFCCCCMVPSMDIAFLKCFRN